MPNWMDCGLRGDCGGGPQHIFTRQSNSSLSSICRPGRTVTGPFIARRVVIEKNRLFPSITLYTNPVFLGKNAGDEPKPALVVLRVRLGVL